jgi:purine-binding chemotaxis protein CheW
MTVRTKDGRYCTFMLGDLHLGVPVSAVQEVIRAQVRTQVPLVSPVIDGLMNLRGVIVTTIDLRRRLGLPSAATDATITREPMNVVIRYEDDSVVSILVDEIRDVIDIGDAELEDVPTTVHGACRDLVTGIHKQDGSLLLILDTIKLLEIPGITGRDRNVVDADLLDQRAFELGLSIASSHELELRQQATRRHQ